jgi:hypothetical protein
MRSGVLTRQLEGAQCLEATFGEIAKMPPAVPGVMQAAEIAEWIQANGVLSVMLNGHESLVKRVTPVLRFLAQHDALRDAHLEALWAAGANKGETISRNVYDTLKACMSLFSPALLAALNTIVHQRKHTDYRHFDVQFVRDFTAFAVNAHPPPLAPPPPYPSPSAKDTKIIDARTQLDNKTISLDSKDVGGGWYGLDLLWQLCQTGEPVESKVRHTAVDNLHWILAQGSFRIKNEFYVTKAIDAVTNPTLHAAAVDSAFSFFQMVLTSFTADKTPAITITRREARMAALDRQHSFVSRIIVSHNFPSVSCSVLMIVVSRGRCWRARGRGGVGTSRWGLDSSVPRWR